MLVDIAIIVRLFYSRQREILSANLKSHRDLSFCVYIVLKQPVNY